MTWSPVLCYGANLARYCACKKARAKEEAAFDEEGDPMTGKNSRFGLDRQGMHHLGTVHWNQSAPVLYEHARRALRVACADRS